MALKSLIDQDAKLALEVCKLDDDVDELKFRQRQIVSEVMEKKPEHIDYSLEVIVNGRRLERIADLCTNIAEDVIYITEGENHVHLLLIILYLSLFRNPDDSQIHNG